MGQYTIWPYFRALNEVYALSLSNPFAWWAKRTDRFGAHESNQNMEELLLAIRSGAYLLYHLGEKKPLQIMHSCSMLTSEQLHKFLAFFFLFLMWSRHAQLEILAVPAAQNPFHDQYMHMQIYISKYMMMLEILVVPAAQNPFPWPKYLHICIDVHTCWCSSSAISLLCIIPHYHWCMESWEKQTRPWLWLVFYASISLHA